MLKLVSKATVGCTNADCSAPGYQGRAKSDQADGQRTFPPGRAGRALTQMVASCVVREAPHLSGKSRHDSRSLGHCQSHSDVGGKSSALVSSKAKSAILHGDEIKGVAVMATPSQPSRPCTVTLRHLGGSSHKNVRRATCITCWFSSPRRCRPSPTMYVVIVAANGCGCILCGILA